MSNFKDIFNIFNYDLEFILFKDDILSAIESEKWLSIGEICLQLHSKGFNMSNKEILSYLNFLIIETKRIIRKDFPNGKTRYYKMKEYFKESNYTKFYSSLNLDNLDRFLVISDTHIGDIKLEDFKLIDSIYNYAEKIGINTIFHLGDLFGTSKDDTGSQIEKDLDSFIINYPHPSKIKTYAFVGNHDRFVNDYLEKGPFFETCDLKTLTFFDHNFYMFPYSNTYNPYKTGSLTANLNNLKVHFSHFLYISFMVSYHPLNSLNDLIKYPANLFIELNNDILLSGHIHQAFFYNIYHQDFKHNTFYLGVPALNKSNLNKTIGYILNFNRDTNNKVISIDIEVLQVDYNYHINIKEVVHHDFNKECNTLKRML